MNNPSARVDRRNFLRIAFLATGATVVNSALAKQGQHVRSQTPVGRTKPFELAELTIADLQARMRSGRDTAKSLAKKYLAQIAEIDQAGPSINSVIEINPDALGIARALDAERRSKGPRGPLHGIP